MFHLSEDEAIQLPFDNLFCLGKQNEASAVKIKTILKMAKKAPAVLKKIKKMKILPKKDPMDWRDDEFMICNWNTLGYSCKSPCQLLSESYRWCY